MATNLDRLRSVQVSALSKESAFDTAEAVDSLIRWNMGVIPVEQVQTVNDQDHIGGTEEPSDSEVFARGLNFGFAQTRAKPHTLAFIAAYALGSCVTSTPGGASTARKHTITPTSSLTMPSFTMEALYKSGLQKQFSGCFVDSFTLNLKRGANRFVDLSGQCYGSGKLTDGTANTTEISEGGLNAADAAVWLAAKAFDGATGDNLTLATSDLADNPAAEGNVAIGLDWTFNNNTDMDFNFSMGSGLYLGSNDRGGRSQTLTYTRLWQDDTYQTAALAQTDLALQVKVKNAAIESGFYYGFNLIFPLLHIASRDHQEQNGRQVEVINFHVLEHATYGSVILDVFNTQTSYAA